MAVQMTAAQTAWFVGFWGYFNGVAQPATGWQKSGWLAAQKTVKEAPASGGGYGEPS